MERALLDSSLYYSHLYGSRTDGEGKSYAAIKADNITLGSGKTLAAIILLPTQSNQGADAYLCSVLTIDEKWALIYSPSSDLTELDWRTITIRQSND